MKCVYPLIIKYLAILVFPSLLFSQPGGQLTIGYGSSKFASDKSNQWGGNSGHSFGLDYLVLWKINFGLKTSLNIEICPICELGGDEYVFNYGINMGYDFELTKKNLIQTVIGINRTYGNDQTRINSTIYENKFKTLGFGSNLRYQYIILNHIGIGLEIFNDWTSENSTYGVRIPLSLRVKGDN